MDAEPAQPKSTSLSEAIEMLDDLAEFAERRLQDESLVSSLKVQVTQIFEFNIFSYFKKYQV